MIKNQILDYAMSLMIKILGTAAIIIWVLLLLSWESHAATRITVTKDSAGTMGGVTYFVTADGVTVFAIDESGASAYFPTLDAPSMGTSSAVSIYSTTLDAGSFTAGGVTTPHSSATSAYATTLNAGAFNSSTLKSRVVSASFTTGTGFSITAADGNTWLIDLSLGSSSADDGDILAVHGGSITGATVVLPTTITQAMDGQPMTFVVSNKSGTSLIVLWAGATATSGVSIESATGITNSVTLPNATGDSIELTPSYANQIYYVTGGRIQ